MKFHVLLFVALLSGREVAANEQGSNALRLYDLKVEHLRDPIQLDVRCLSLQREVTILQRPVAKIHGVRKTTD